VITGFPAPIGLLDYRLLQHRDILQGDLHTQIPSGHHEAVCSLDDLIQVAQGLMFSQSSQSKEHRHPPGLQDPASFLYIRGRSNKGIGPMKSDPLLDPKLHILLILFGEGGDGEGPLPGG